MAQTVPLPPPRPSLPAALPAPATEPAAPPPPSACFQRLNSKLAIASAMSGVNGAGGCGAEDVVQLEAIVLADKTRVAVTPPAVVRCDLAEALAHFVRDDVAPAVAPNSGAARGASSTTIPTNAAAATASSGRSSPSTARATRSTSRAIRLGNGSVVDLTSVMVAKDLRERVRPRACARFNTVLGPGSDGYHENHIHLDLAQRSRGYKMCQWDVREPPAAVPDAVQVPLAAAAAAPASDQPLGAIANSAKQKRRRDGRRLLSAVRCQSCRQICCCGFAPPSAMRGLNGESPCFGRQHHHRSCRSSPGCRGRSRPRWSCGCSRRRSPSRCIPAGWCRECGTACPCCPWNR